MARRNIHLPTSMPRRNIHLPTSMPSPGFVPIPYGTAVSVTNHYAGWTDLYTYNSYYFTILLYMDGENASQAAEIMNGVYGADTVTANYVQFWFRRFRSGIFDVKVAPHKGRPVIENVYKITEIIEVDRQVSSLSIAQELKIDHKTVLSHLSKVGFKKKLDVWVPHQLTPKSMMDRISICEILAKRNEIDPFLKRMVTEDEKCVTYDNIE
ncbi:histone-lysine N-methyltransferase SETMAR [Trichonephila clavipes]|nr:histone-lysine N-methyltransferase SETMAR [Trichonephila clavipes]